ncbi:hypothetical protein HanPI659440_Chr10g0361441 [Helianthus annuus]|nr:hypothetical protein HanPI659440_Chr10g0361441 [Helianthus annuus]
MSKLKKSINLNHHHLPYLMKYLRDNIKIQPLTFTKSTLLNSTPFLFCSS